VGPSLPLKGGGWDHNGDKIGKKGGLGGDGSWRFGLYPPETNLDRKKPGNKKKGDTPMGTLPVVGVPANIFTAKGKNVSGEYVQGGREMRNQGI